MPTGYVLQYVVVTHERLFQTPPSIFSLATYKMILAALVFFFFNSSLLPPDELELFSSSLLFLKAIKKLNVGFVLSFIIMYLPIVFCLSISIAGSLVARKWVVWNRVLKDSPVFTLGVFCQPSDIFER